MLYEVITEDEVVGDRQQFDDVALLEGGGEGMHLAAELLAPEAGFPRRTGANSMQRPADKRKSAPHGESFERHENLRPAAPLHLVEDGEVVAQPPRITSYNVCYTKLLRNIGTSKDATSIDKELAKTRAAVKAGADAIMDLSTGGPVDEIRRAIIAEAGVCIGSVPLYQAALDAVNP